MSDRTAAPYRVLWVEASPKGETSLSSACARAYLEGLAAGREDVEVEHLDVWDAGQLVPFGRDEAIAKFAPILGEERTVEQQRGWERVEAEIRRIGTFDRIVVSCPMWNWGVPYPLKHWLDVLVQPLLSFSLDERGRHVGVLGRGRPVQLVLTRSSAYDGRHPELEDHQRPYLEYVFGMLGYATDALVFEPTTRWPPEARQEHREESLAAARRQGELAAEAAVSRSAG